jgi:hypothetical protein
MEVFRQAAETYTRDLLARIAKDYSLPLDDLLKYADLTPTPVAQTPAVQTPTAPKAPNPFDKPLCQAVTSTGTRCRFYARQDGLCGKHCLPTESPRTCQPVACSGTTAKGAPCKFAAKTDGLCGTHLRKTLPLPPTAPTVPVSPSPVRSRAASPSPPVRAPKTTTAPRKAPSPNPTVQPKATTTSPSVLEEDPEDDEEVSDSPGLQERLRAILREASESDDDPDDEDGEPSLNMDALRAALDTVDVSELLSEEDEDDD